MSVEKKGHVKISVDIEISEALMDLMREGMANVPQMMAQFRKKGKTEE